LKGRICGFRLKGLFGRNSQLLFPRFKGLVRKAGFGLKKGFKTGKFRGFGGRENLKKGWNISFVIRN